MKIFRVKNINNVDNLLLHRFRPVCCGPTTTSQYLISRTCSLTNEITKLPTEFYKRKFHSFQLENYSWAAIVFLIGSSLLRSPFSVRKGWSGEMRWERLTASQCPPLTRAVSPDSVEYKKRNKYSIASLDKVASTGKVALTSTKEQKMWKKHLHNHALFNAFPYHS